MMVAATRRDTSDGAGVKSRTNLESRLPAAPERSTPTRFPTSYLRGGMKHLEATPVWSELEICECFCDHLCQELALGARVLTGLCLNVCHSPPSQFVLEYDHASSVNRVPDVDCDRSNPCPFIENMDSCLKGMEWADTYENHHGGHHGGAMQELEYGSEEELFLTENDNWDVTCFEEGDVLHVAG